MRLLLAMFLFAGVAFASEQKQSVQLVNQFLEEILAPAKDEVVSELSLAFDEAETDFTAPKLKLDGAVKFEKAFWAPRTGARLTASLSAKGEVSGKDPTKATSRLALKVGLETRTLPLVRFSASRLYEEACGRNHSTDEIRDLVCTTLEQLESVPDITRFSEVVTPAIEALVELLKEEAPELAAGLKYNLEKKGEGKDAEFVWATQYNRVENAELDWLRSAVVVVKLSETGTSVELVLEVDHDAQYLEQAKELLATYTEEISKLSAEEKEEIKASVRKTLEEAKGVVVGGKLEYADSLLGLWLKVLR